MRKICFLLFSQASLIAFLFYFHSYDNGKVMNQNWEAFLDTELVFQNQQHSISLKHAHKTSRKSESLRKLFNSLNQFEQNIYALYERLESSTNKTVVQSTLDSMRLLVKSMDVEYHEFYIEELIDNFGLSSNNYQIFKKALKWNIDKSLNDIRFFMMPTCDFSIPKYHFELIKDKQQSKLFFIGEHQTLNYAADVYIDDQLDLDIYRSTSITKTATKEGENYMSVMVKNGESVTLKKFKYYVYPNKKLAKP
jgi:hypothetical protein